MTGLTMDIFRFGHFDKGTAAYTFTFIFLIVRPKVNTMTQGYQPITMDTFRGGFFARFIAFVTLFFFTFVFYANPAAAAVANELNKDDQREAALEAAIETTPEKKLSHRLAKLRDKIVLELPQTIEQREAEQNWFESAFVSIFGDGPITAEELAELQTLSTNIDAAYQEAISDFETEASDFEQEAAAAGNALSAEVKQLIQSRHAEALDHIKNRYAQTQAQLTALINAQSASAQEQALEQLNQSLEQEQFKPTHTPATPDNLPWSAPDESVREPVDNPQDLQAALGVNPYAKYAQIAQAGDADPGLIAQAMANAANVELQAALTESVEVQLTPEIKALAAQLNNNSIEIYTWVHNNIRFIPSYGSIQGAQHTLETKQGNAIDTASLLISLLRAANIPARYAYGTIEIPAEKVMNWVGGAKTPEAAQGILGMGGVPTIGILEGGKITKFKLEHTWVEAYVDYFPSRGMKEKVGDSWIPMDASFKQYDFIAGMNLKDQVPLDTAALVSAIEAQSTISDEGWVQNVPNAYIETQLVQFQEQIETFIGNQNPDATVGDVLGLQEVKVLPPRPLAAGLPYNRIITSQTFNEVPNNLRHKFKYTLATESYGYANSPFITIEEPTAKLAGKTLALSFKPATQADANIIAARFPAPEEDGSIDPKKLPKTLPGYLINMIAEFTINGEIVQSGAAGTMGGELNEVIGLWSPKEGWGTSVNHPSTGEYRAIGLDLQGFNEAQLNRLLSKKEEIASEQRQFSSVSKHDTIGNTLFSGILSYLYLNDVFDRELANAMDILSYKLPSYGVFSTGISAQYWYGIPRSIEFSGWSIDVDSYKRQTLDKSGNRQSTTAYNQAIGVRLSTMEHLIPEQLFSTETTRPVGFSAIKALSMAANTNQKIYTIDKNNLSLVISKINLNIDIKNEIINSVNAGKIVTTHESNILHQGYVLAGYIITDPLSGAAAYKISSGKSGGFLDFSKAVLSDPSLLFPECSGSFVDQTIDNFINTNSAIFGMFAPPGLTFLTGGAVAEAAGGFTLLRAIMLSIKNPTFLLGNLRVALIVSMINFILVSIAWEIGLLIGSMISAAACRDPK